jgi:hypothetical protein
MLARRSFMFGGVGRGRMDSNFVRGKRKRAKGEGMVLKTDPGRRLKVGDAVNAWPTSVGGGWTRMEDIVVVLFVFFFASFECK